LPNTAINRSALSAIGFVLGQRAPGYFSVGRQKHVALHRRLASADFSKNC
jgi:hypothetical protein